MSSKQINDLSEYNVDFAGVTGDSLGRMRLRLFKRELMENGNVNPRYIRAGVREFIPGMEQIIAKIPPGSSLIVMPTTTGRNRIPAMLAEAIRKKRPDLEIVNSESEVIKVNHKSESKIKDNFISRLNDHRSFKFSDNLLKIKDQLNRSSLILDDSISTGDTAIMLHRQLLREGIYAQKIITAVAGSKYHVRLSDIERLTAKVEEALPVGYSKMELKRDMYNTFAGYPESKIKRVELALTRDKNNPIYNRPDLVVHVVRSTSAYLDRERLGPEHMVEIKRKILGQQEPRLSAIPKQRKGPRLL